MLPAALLDLWVEAHSTTAFYRTLAMLSREAIQAMYNELLESSEQNPEA